MPYSHEKSSHYNAQIKRLLCRSCRLLPNAQVFPLNFSIVAGDRYLLSSCLRWVTPKRTLRRIRSEPELWTSSDNGFPAEAFAVN